ncbi:MAG: DUF2147 domain-containing protein [Bacteroidota bacterium]
MRVIFSVFLAFICLIGFAQDEVLRKWKTIDDESGKARSVVEIYEKDGLYYGKIVKLFREPGEDPDPICTECEGEKKGQKVIGMEIISEMKYNKGNDEFQKGEILDPENGNVYDCKIWIEEGKLMVRGYLLFFYRTQTWLPYTGE